MKKLTVFLIVLFLGFSFPLMAKDHGDKGHQGKEMHQDQGQHRGHYKQNKYYKPHRDRYYQSEYVQNYHHGRHKHYHRDNHGHYVAVYVQGYHEDICSYDHGYYNDNGSFINLNVDSRGNANIQLNLDLNHH
jgi:hypothetical protein